MKQRKFLKTGAQIRKHTGEWLTGCSQTHDHPPPFLEAKAYLLRVGIANNWLGLYQLEMEKVFPPRYTHIKIDKDSSSLSVPSFQKTLYYVKMSVNTNQLTKHWSIVNLPYVDTWVFYFWIVLRDPWFWVYADGALGWDYHKKVHHGRVQTTRKNPMPTKHPSSIILDTQVDPHTALGNLAPH